MNIIENGNIDWSMFGMSVKNYRRGKGLSTAQFADMMNRVSGGEKEIISESVVERIEAGKAKPTIDQLLVIDKITNRPNRMTSVIDDVAETLMFGEVAEVPGPTHVPVAGGVAPVPAE